MCFIAVVTLWQACGINKHLKQNEYLVQKNELMDNGTHLEKSDLEAFIRQKPNRKILQLFRFNLWLYNQVDQQKMLKQKEVRNARYDRINEKRIARTNAKNKKRAARGKSPKSPKLKNKDKLTFRESILDAGEAPVILDTFLTHLTTKQLQKYVYSKGYFDTRVRDSIAVNVKDKRAKVYYFISKSKPYTIRNISYTIEDPLIEYFIYNDTLNSLIKRGKRYDEEVLQNERTRITDVQLDNGYYYFAPEYIYYVVDTNMDGQLLDITIGVKKYAEAYSASNDSLVYKSHPRFTIHKVYVVLENVTENVRNAYFRDTTEYNNVYFLHNAPLHFKRRDIYKQISVAEGQLYQQSLAEDTYKALTGLRVFKAVSIQYFRNTKNPDMLDCFVYCPPLVKQSITTETEGTNTSGNLGIAGSIVFQNRNAFRGAELVELKLKGSVAAQHQLTNQQQNENINNIQKTFNTFQFGPELNIFFPKPLFPFTLFYFKKDEKSKRIFAQPKTYVNISVNYQSRPEYARTISSISYGFRFSNNKNVFQYDVIPLEVYSVKAKLFGTFEQDLKNLNDYFLLNTFRDHLTTLSKVSVVYNNQSIAQGRSYTYLKVNLSSSGNILRGLYTLTDQPKDTAGRYNIYSIPFSQFLKIDADWRFYIKVRKLSKLVFRVAGGIGKPLANLNVLPYEQSFFSGGPNSVRAWRARTLGPGSYDPSQSTARYDKLGDIQMEGNFEYRFHIFKAFYGAWFADAGNVWLSRPQSSKPNGEFKFNTFYKEFGVGTGFGIRYDFSFFVLRLDGAFRVYDPQYALGNRWTFDKQPIRKTSILNFGIGYPF
ncbi:MAG: BamA/TamA family outer membrane protein [Bacteroidetes bacterium]|nr:BamA/TamA family outer membrane protein [Bacteroidota bacterium]